MRDAAPYKMKWPDDYFALLLAVPFVLPFMAIQYVIEEVPRKLIRNVRWNWMRARARIAGRVTSWEEVEAALRRGSGTILIDSRPVGWSFDLWWTDDPVLAEASREGVPLPEVDLLPTIFDETQRRLYWLVQGVEIKRTRTGVFDDWCQTRYTSLRSGNARLLATPRTRWGFRLARRRLEQLRKSFPSLECVHVWTTAWRYYTWSVASDGTTISARGGTRMAFISSGQRPPPDGGGEHRLARADGMNQSSRA
jgi:hypothetical protein